jgi:hypothetical protein
MFHHAHFPFVMIFLLFVVALLIFGGYKSSSKGEQPPK